MDTTTTTPDGPPRPDVAPSLHHRERRWLPTLIVLGVIVVTVVGGFVVAAVLSEPAGPAVTVGGTVRVQPLSGWEPAAGATTAGALPFARLTRGGGNLDVVVAPSFDQDADALVDHYVNDVLEVQLSGLSVSNDLHPVLLSGGQTGQRFNYAGVTDTGASIEGEATVVIDPSGDGVIFDGWAHEGLLTFVDGDLHTMESRAVFT